MVLTVWRMRGSAGRGQQPRKIRLSIMAMTRRGWEEGVLAFPLSEWSRGGPWGVAWPIRTALGYAFGWPERGYPVPLVEDASVNKDQAGTPAVEERTKQASMAEEDSPP
ncbi:UNVERIFIED_CONTAM: hypothetical protein FKN15_059746 [Acipenser sinensis]